MPVVGPMTRAEALEASIEKWRQIEAGTKRELGSSDCALCQFYMKDPVCSCRGCPVSQKTGRTVCRGTPYINWHVIAGYRAMADTDEKKELARAEREFLESLREKPSGDD